MNLGSCYLIPMLLIPHCMNWNWNKRQNLNVQYVFEFMNIDNKPLVVWSLLVVIKYLPLESQSKSSTALKCPPGTTLDFHSLDSEKCHEWSAPLKLYAVKTFANELIWQPRNPKVFPPTSPTTKDKTTSNSKINYLHNRSIQTSHRLNPNSIGIILLLP